MEIVRSFRKDPRSYDSTPDGWRLATFEEAKNGLDSIKEQQHLGEWERARLLDGWISGPGYEYEMRQEFRGCMGYMLLIQTQTSAQNASGTPYADVNLSELGKAVALFLCVDDWNYEVLYWLLNSWSNCKTMNLAHVRGGKLPFVNAADFQKMNGAIGRLARRLAVEEVAAREKARKIKYSGTDSVEEVLTGMIQIVKEEEQLFDDNKRVFRRYGGDKYFIPESVQTGDVAETFWTFACDTFAGYAVEVCAYYSLRNISLMKTEGKSKKNLMVVTSILLYLSDYRSDIIHESLPHNCISNCGGKILKRAEEKANGNHQKLSEMLKHNAMWRCYDEEGNYGVLNKLLFVVAKGKHGSSRKEGEMREITAHVVGMLLKCGAQPAGCYAIHNDLKNTTLHNAAEFEDKDVSREIAQLLLDRCDEESRTHFVNEVNENGMTALHIASTQGNASLCQLLVEFNASVNAQDLYGRTPLHHALEVEMDEVINALVKSPEVSESVDLKDEKGYTPLDRAIDKKDYASAAKLLLKSKEPEAYLIKVDQEQLLRYSLISGSADIVKKLYGNEIKLPAGNCDEDGKPALHLAAMGDDEVSAMEIIEIILSGVKTPGQDKNMVAECDRRGRTVLHEAALIGHAELCEFLLKKNPKLIYMKDRDGRNPLYDLVKGKYKIASGQMELLNAWVEKDMPVEDLTDRSVLTPLHVAVSQRNVEFVKALLSIDSFKFKYLSRGDFWGQTALHKAASCGDIEIVKILLKHGAHPLRERDYDGRTALHYAVEAETGNKKKLVDALFSRCESDDEKVLLLWASAGGLGTADQNLRNNDPLHKYLLQKKSQTKETNLLRVAASGGNIEMTKELIDKGYQIGDILDSKWRSCLNLVSRDNATRVLKQIDLFNVIIEQRNDKPAILDTLGRSDYAQGLAALFLNPSIKPPIAVGITGSWGMGKSSLMIQTQHILLTTAAQMALLESSKSLSLVSELSDFKSYRLSTKGRRKCENIYKHIKYGERESFNRNLNMKKIQEELKIILEKCDHKYRKVFKSLAAMDSSGMFETNALRPKADPLAEENVPAVLTVQYNAWKYRNDTEALAGMAVEITKELEGVMTHAQWLSTCCRYTWLKKKYILWIEIFFPCLLALVLVSSLTWIAWVVFESDKFKEWVKAKYAWPPTAIVIIVWTLTKSVMGILKPVSTQLMQYVSFPDHTAKLGYQERVISDITFLKDEIGKNAYWVFIVFGWVFTTFTVFWRLITESWVTSLLFHQSSLEKAIDAPKVTPASGSSLRIVVFVDDLDRCQESVILQVLSAINIVLAECEINVVMGMDKRLIQRAIMKKYGDGKANRSQELADLYLQKIIQLPLDLPDPSEEQSRRFLEGQLGVLETGDKVPDLKLDNARDPADEEPDDGESTSTDGEAEAEPQNAPTQVSINMSTASEKAETDDSSSRRGDAEVNVLQSVSEKKCLKLFKFPVRNILHTLHALWKAKIETETIESSETGRQAPSETEEDELLHKLTGKAGRQIRSMTPTNPSSSLLRKEMLFVRYSRGEQNAFLYFQGLATDCRKLPREWKRLLSYHRLVWYILSLSKEAKNLAGWQVQLVTWIFICWEWQENMNLVIEKWKEVSDPKTSRSNEPPSLLMIVEHLMEEHKREVTKTIATGNEEDRSKRTEKLGGSVAKINNKEKLNENTDDIENMEKGASQKLVKDINKLDAIEKSLAELKKEMKKSKGSVSDELKEEMKELIKQVSDELKEEIEELKKQVSNASNELKEEMKELKKQVSDELKKDINEMREQMAKMQNGRNQQNMENKKIKMHNVENWKRMKSTLERYDVPMDGILAFQRFRFNCIAGYLPRPSLEG